MWAWVWERRGFLVITYTLSLSPPRWFRVGEGRIEHPRLLSTGFTDQPASTYGLLSEIKLCWSECECEKNSFRLLMHYRSHAHSHSPSRVTRIWTGDLSVPNGTRTTKLLHYPIHIKTKSLLVREARMSAMTIFYFIIQAYIVRPPGLRMTAGVGDTNDVNVFCS